MVKDYYSNVNQKEIQVYGNDNECIQSKKQLFLVKKNKKIKKHTGNKKQSKKHWKKSENLIIKQKYVKTYPRDK